MNKTDINLIPKTKNPSPDYYCTWQTQLYATCDGKPEGQRAVIGEKALFDNQKPFGWANFYEKAREDLFFVMDDSWDVPFENDGSFYGSLVLNDEKFPSFANKKTSNQKALKMLSDKIKSMGWKGLGGWVCAQKSKAVDFDLPKEEYWKKRILEANEAGISYWKVDWGDDANDFEFRKMLSDLAKKYAPGLIVEQSMTFDVLPFCDTFRTYDVPAVMSVPATIKKLADIFSLNGIKGEAGIINCEDEVYIAAAGGFSMGVMRHPYSGEFLNGKADMSFPKLGRNLKTKMYEVLRAARWHRIAPAFKGCLNEVKISNEILSDSWRFEDKTAEIEEWWFLHSLVSESLNGDTVVKKAPSQLARDCDFAKAEKDENGDIPYIVTSKNPNGAFSVATLGRTNEREYKIPKCSISINAEDSQIIGVFGEYKSLCINTLHKNIKSVLMQDLASDYAFDITENIRFFDGGFEVLGDFINKIGTLEQPKDDTSEPGVVIKICV